MVICGCCRNDPDLCSLRYWHTMKEQSYLYEVGDVPSHPLTLPEVVQIALYRNLDLLVRDQERAVEEEILTSARLKVLPALTVDAVDSERSNPPLFTDSSPTSEKLTKTVSARAAWGIVDFGLTYFKARQESNRLVHLEQQHIRIRQNLILDVIGAYWKAIAAKNSVCDAEELLAEATNLRLLMHKHLDKRNLSELQALKVDEQVVEAQVKLSKMKYEFDSSLVKLKSLLGLPPSIHLDLEDAQEEDEPIAFDSIHQLEEMALLSRPELYEKDIEEKIAADEVRVNIVQMFPNATLFGMYNYDANKFLVFHHWSTLGTSATWNLLTIPQLTYGMKAAQQQKYLARVSRLALSIGVITQVNLAYINYLNAKEQYQFANDNFQIKTRLVNALEKENRVGEFGGIELLNERFLAIEAKYAAMLAFADLQAAIEQVNNSIGHPMLYGKVSLDDVLQVNECEESREEDTIAVDEEFFEIPNN